MTPDTQVLGSRSDPEPVHGRPRIAAFPARPGRRPRLDPSYGCSVVRPLAYFLNLNICGQGAASPSRGGLLPPDGFTPNLFAHTLSCGWLVTPAWGVRVLRPCCGLCFLLWGGRVRLHGEGFGLYRGARRRVLTVGALVLALSASVVSAGAASPSPSGSPPTAASGAPSPSSSPKSPSLPAASPSSGASAKPAPKPSVKSVAPKVAAGAASTSNAVYAYDAAGSFGGADRPGRGDGALPL